MKTFDGWLGSKSSYFKYCIYNSKELNYGGIGFSFGHELSHGFDDNGRKYDGEGNLKDWWNEKSLAGFKEKTLCLENQFANYSLYNNKINPR